MRRSSATAVTVPHRIRHCSSTDSATASRPRPSIATHGYTVNTWKLWCGTASTTDSSPLVTWPAKRDRSCAMQSAGSTAANRSLPIQ